MKLSQDVDRRTILKAGAWTLPALAVVSLTAEEAVAASGPPAGGGGVSGSTVVYAQKLLTAGSRTITWRTPGGAPMSPVPAVYGGGFSLRAPAPGQRAIVAGDGLGTGHTFWSGFLATNLYTTRFGGGGPLDITSGRWSTAGSPAASFILTPSSGDSYPTYPETDVATWGDVWFVILDP